MTRRESTIKYVVPNLRRRWEKELQNYSDNTVAAMYEDFSASEDHGNNDERVHLWFEMLDDYKESNP